MICIPRLIDPEKVVIGGKSDPDRRYIDPTVIYSVTWSDRIMADEIFGPILAVMAYDDIDEALIVGERSEMRIAEGAVLAISRVLAPILPKKIHINPASVIAALLDSVLTAKAGCRWIFAEELNQQRTT